VSAFILHIATISEWSAAQRAGRYRPTSLATDGFIHCSTPEQVATLPGQRLYSACGYQSEAPEQYALDGDQSITFVSMHKRF
jgi:hypothetical protein